MQAQSIKKQINHKWIVFHGKVEVKTVITVGIEQRVPSNCKDLDREGAFCCWQGGVEQRREDYKIVQYVSVELFRIY